MVAATEVAKSRQCSAVEAYFARLVACEGMLPSRAYRVAWKTDAKRAHELGGRALARPWVAAKVADLRAQLDREAVMGMNERRRLLAETARKASGNPTHSDRIAAVREDAILAGERRSDGSQIALSIDVTANIVVAALRGLTEPRNVTEIATGGVVQSAERPDERAEVRQVAGSIPVAVQQLPVAPAEAYGPLGVIEESATPAPSLPAASFVDSE